nr:Wadjet anti-phage system protein JetD domain-containing protein [Escherichia coli]
MLVEGSSKLNPDKLNKLRKAQEIFAEVCAFTQRYQDCLLDVNKDFERARLKLIIPRDNTLFRETLEKGALIPLLSHSPDIVEKEIDGLIARLLAPRRQDDDRHILFDPEALLNLYLDRFEQALPHEIQDPTDQPVAIETNLRNIPESVIKKCSDWVSDRLKNWGHVSFRDVFDAYECEEFSEQEQQVCLLHIGSLAANSDPAIEVEICQLNQIQTRWSLVIYGAGNKVSGQAECVSQLLEAEQVEQLLYFGDLDVAGLKIAHQLRCKLLNDYGISLHLDEWLYNELILNGLMTAEGNANNERFDFELQCGWMPKFVLREMKTLLAIHRRLPQEGVASLGLVI